MTRHPARRLLALALASASLAPALAQRPTRSRPGRRVARAPARPGAFTVTDIRVDGLQRISAGTVFTYLPIERGDTRRPGHAPPRRSARCTRPASSRTCAWTARATSWSSPWSSARRSTSSTLTGNKDIKTEDLMKGLKDIGLAEGETFDRLSLDRVTQELTRQYNNRGKYNVEITPDRVAPGPQPRRRHDRDQGRQGRQDPPHQPGRQREVRATRTILDDWESSEHNWLRWYRRDDQYSREKLSGDLEKLNNYYLDRGYVDFSVDSTQVAISPDRAGHVHHRRRDRGRPVQGLRRCKVTGDTVLPQGTDREAGAGQGRPDLLAPPAGDHLRRDHRHARQHRLRLRPGQPDPGRRPRKPRPSASTSRSCRARASTCAASSSRATPAPPTKCCAAKCASSKARGTRRRRSTAPRSACSAWATSRPSTSRRSRSPAATTRSTWSSTSRKPPRAASCSAWATRSCSGLTTAGPAVAEQLPRQRQPRLGRRRSAATTSSATTSRSSTRTSPTTACRSATTCGGASSTTPTSTPRSTPATAAPARWCWACRSPRPTPSRRCSASTATRSSPSAARRRSAIIDYIDALGQRTFHAWRTRAGLGARHAQRLT